MDNTAPIVPTFNGELAHGAATLCDFFLVPTEDQVPVTKVTILVDGDKHKFAVGNGKYRSTLFLLYCAVLKQSTSFTFDAELKAMLVPYFSAELVDQAKLPETEHVALGHLVIGKSIQVNLVLKPGYELPKNPGRSLRKLIEHGWNQRKQLGPNSAAPLIRQAVQQFIEGERSGAIRVHNSRRQDVWPDYDWVDNVRSLRRLLAVSL